MACCVRGYHVWAAAFGEVLACRREPSNASDRYAIEVLKHGTIIGHLRLPRKISKVCSLFLRRGGSIRCTVTGSMASGLADAIAADGTVVESDRFGSGRPSIGFKYGQVDMRPAIAFQDPESHENCMHCIRARALF